jgi:hypothetical protein
MVLKKLSLRSFASFVFALFAFKLSLNRQDRKGKLAKKRKVIFYS